MNGKKISLRALAITLAMGVSMNAMAGLFGMGGTSWKEEVLLHDGSKIVVERYKDRYGRHEIGQKPPTGNQSIEFAVPGANRTLIWRDEYSKDIGSANFNLIALHILNGTPYIVVTAYGCLSYNKWDRPNPPYIVFKYDGQNWQRISLTDLPTEFRTINLVANDSREEDIKKAADKLGYVSAEGVQQINSSLRQLEYKTILREALPESALCPDWRSQRYTSPKAPD